ncbi:MAG: domain, 2-phospho-L-lactate transferase 2 [Hydrocarboniphaga sp.]|uniref:2-phospho-L-lactate transferase n=1 Tax=Hydrocarboniphaga sp. TaxID=2033016 RepID=UPI002618BEFA|nr:2-phospho-L-lactate transferase [Hydrocarboniphaga sp.]MDB5968616.1 domain, 2-phospho-L-lactate transferase 2 [Hydrocarboniphaga sp.]
MRAQALPTAVDSKRYLALSGGVGGAKLAAGLAQALPAESLVVAVNIGDDFEHLGLTICPDLDTVLYTLAGVVHPQQGWGRADESFGVLEELRRLDGDSWFSLGDRDIALHLLRRQLLAQGLSLSQVSAELAHRLGVTVTVLPVSDQPVRTTVHTDQGSLAFQDYFVRLRCEPVLRGLEFKGAAQARLAPALRELLASPELAGVIICPSNPYLSLAPMLAITELRESLRALRAPVLAVSPIVAGDAIKGPTAKIMRELGVQPHAGVIAELYADFVDAVIIDEADAELAGTDSRFVVAPTVMQTLDQKTTLARHCIALAEKLRS